MALRSFQQLGHRAAFSAWTPFARQRPTVRSMQTFQFCQYHALTPLPRTLGFHRSATNPLPYTRLVVTQTATSMPAGDTRIPLKFDKVPDKLPDWWDDEDDEDEEAENSKQPNGDGGDGSSGGGGDGSGGYGSNNGSSNGDGGEKGFFAGLLAMYVRAVKTNPVRTKAASTALLSIVGDYLAQHISQQDDPSCKLDIRRTLSVGIWGFIALGPSLHYWYAALDRLFFGKFAVLYKVVADQLLFSTVSNAAFMAGVGTLEGHPFRETLETVRTKIWPSMKANWTLWPAAQLINFACVPKSFQIVYVNCIALIWSVILAYIAHDT